ncbi:dnaJ (Hsp40) homolog, subfamily C, member 30b [Xiphophorus couchianus]|uniref:dnaJ (Hsp40) homolog, subfamily C, member 30b n=1 Tax=Xiphophorus couchianus TaxID=32473 RepID=UPI001015F49C|nr:uncharacterized protein LOC114162060 [Xiphophorus couchianus]
MAEVSQRLGTGAYRLVTVGPGHVRPLRPVSPSGLLPINDTCIQGHFTKECVQLLKGRALQSSSEKLNRVRQTATHQRKMAFLGCTSLNTHLARLFWLPVTRKSQTVTKTNLLIPTGRLQEKLFSCVKPIWTSGAVSTHPDTRRSPQQLRAFCTVLLILADDRSGSGASLTHPKLHPGACKASAAARSYSRWSEEAPLLHRSKTAYYDILKVSPRATQSQVKTAYYKQSFIYHPDKNPGSKEATQRFAEISEAYTVLGNISLRRKYDRGILSQSDLQSPEKPSSKDASSRATSSQQQQQPQQQHYRQQRARPFSQTGGRPMFDFDAFFQAHYGEQLQRERDLRVKRKQMEEEQKKRLKEYRQEKMLELAALMLATMSVMILINLFSS